ncbi:hypothetical protein HYY75_01910 [bacterium]|nr:hypothetical protein [bacterium]
MGQNTTIMKVFRFSLFACFFLSVFFLANPRVLFSGENLSQDNSFDSADESDQVESLSQTHPFKPVNEKKDPFKPLIRRPDRQERIHFEPIVASEPIIQPPPAPPIKLVVQGICGNSNDRWLTEFAGMIMIGWQW